jgi:hypothetical protein
LERAALFQMLLCCQRITRHVLVAVDTKSK